MSTAETLRDLASDGAPLLAEATQPLAEALAELELRLRRAEGPAVIDALCADLFAAGGKRLRPLAALSSAQAVALERGPALVLAEVAELTHGAALLHDDVIDEADTRRGREAARRRWSNTLSILGGDYLLVRSLRMIGELAAPAVQALYLDTLEDLLGSEALQHSARRSHDISVSGYLQVAEGKTGSLFGFACAAPVLLRGATDAAALLDRFGREMGIAFQIADDLRDVLALDPGKPAALDLLDGVASLPLRCAAALDPAIGAFLEAAQRQRPTTAALADTLAKVRASSALGDAVAQGHTHLDRARAALAALPDAARYGAHHAVLAWLDGELQQQAQRIRQA